jgi:hypothetical protein
LTVAPPEVGRNTIFDNDKVGPTPKSHKGPNLIVVGFQPLDIQLKKSTVEILEPSC